jgi:RNA polymerase sigma factor (sigma-70 family)
LPNKTKHPKRVYPNQYEGMLTRNIPELLEWYKDTLKDVQEVYESYTERIKAYKDNTAYPDRNDAHEDIQRLEAERSHVSRMITDLEYSIEWMETSRRPGNKRGIERRSYEQRTIVKDPAWVQAMIKAKQGQKTLSDEELQKLDDLLGCLNTEQYEVFTMIRGKCFSYEECARMLGMTKSNVQYHLERAEEVLREKVKGGSTVELQGTLF